MAMNLNDMAAELEHDTSWQKTPVKLHECDYLEMITKGLKRLYIDTGRASLYNNSMITGDSQGNVLFTEDLPIDEEAYVHICAKLYFFQKVATDVNRMIGYSTDALTVTNADKPYANLKDTMDRLENERRITHYKMVRYTMSS